MRPFDRVVLIFNPASTGDASALSAELCAELPRRQPDLPVTLQPTEHAGHARDLARDAARTGRPLLVSVSGDGGYNEVVDGTMQAGNDAVVCAVLPAGNANDHRRATREQPLADAIVTGSVTRIDLLRLTVGGSSPTTRYAHSYVGLGLTPVVAVDLEKGGKGSLKEALTVMRAFSNFRPFEIQLEDGSHQRFDSIVFANISQMAKVATVSEDDGRPDDGRFEVITVKHTAKWRLLGIALKAALRGLGPQPSVRDYRFTNLEPMPIQVDGEVMDLGAGAAVRIHIAHQAMQTLLSPRRVTNAGCSRSLNHPVVYGDSMPCGEGVMTGQSIRPVSDPCMPRARETVHAVGRDAQSDRSQEPWPDGLLTQGAQRPVESCRLAR